MGGGPMSEADTLAAKNMKNVADWNRVVRWASMKMPQKSGILLPQRHSGHKKPEYLCQYTARLLTTVFSEANILANYTPEQQEIMLNCHNTLMNIHYVLVSDVRYPVPYISEHAGFI